MSTFEQVTNYAKATLDELDAQLVQAQGSLGDAMAQLNSTEQNLLAAQSQIGGQSQQIDDLTAQVATLTVERDALQAELNAPKDGLPTGIDPTTGAPYVRYETLYQPGDTVTEALNRLTYPAVVTFGEGEYSFSGRNAKTREGTETEAGINLQKDVVRGLWGVGPGTLGGNTGTRFVDTPGAPGKAGSHMIRAVGTGPLVLHGFQVVGADQGGLDFQGIYVYSPTGAVLAEDLLIAGWQGSSGSPPGETFGLLVYTSKGIQPVTVRRVECDGRRQIGGDLYGTVGITLGKGVGGLIEDCHVHHNRISARVVLYHTTDATIRRTIMGDPDEPSNGWPFNSECSQRTTLEDCTFGHASGKIHLTWSNTNHSDTWGGVQYPYSDGRVLVRDPKWTPEGFSGQFAIQSWQTGIDGSNVDTIVTPPVVVDAAGKGLTYHWHHGTHQTIVSANAS